MSCQVCPSLVYCYDLVPEGSFGDAFRPPSRFPEQAHHAGLFVIQAPPCTAQGLVLEGLLNIQYQGLEHEFRWQLLARGVPALNGQRRARKNGRNNLVVDAAEQHVDDRENERDQQERQNGDDQQECTDAPAGRRPAQARLQRHAVGGSERAIGGRRHVCGSVSRLAASKQRGREAPLHPAPLRLCYLASQVLNTSSSSARWSAHQT